MMVNSSGVGEKDFAEVFEEKMTFILERYYITEFCLFAPIVIFVLVEIHIFSDTGQTWEII